MTLIFVFAQCRVGVIPTKIGCGAVSRSMSANVRWQESVAIRIFLFQLHLEEVKEDFLLWLQFSNQKSNSCNLIFNLHKAGMYKVHGIWFISGNLKNRSVWSTYVRTDRDTLPLRSRPWIRIFAWERSYGCGI